MLVFDEPTEVRRIVIGERNITFLTQDEVKVVDKDLITRLAIGHSINTEDDTVRGERRTLIDLPDNTLCKEEGHRGTYIVCEGGKDKYTGELEDIIFNMVHACEMSKKEEEIIKGLV